MRVPDTGPLLQVFLAADCIYDNNLTEAFMRTAAQLLQGAPRSSLLLALERRFNFTLRDMVRVAAALRIQPSCAAHARS